MSEDRDRAIAIIAERKSRFERDLLRAKLSAPGGLDARTVTLAGEVLAEFDRLTTKAATVDEPGGADADELKQAAVGLARMRAYVLPIVEVRQEAEDLVTTMEDWGVPRDVLNRWRNDLERLPRIADAEARAMFRTIIWDTDYWSDNIDVLFELRNKFMWWIVPVAAFAGAAGLSLFLNGAPLAGFFFGAAAGAGASLLRRPPPLAVYRRVADILPRAGVRWFTGVAAAFIALGLLQAGLVKVPLPNGGDLIAVFSACSPACSPAQALVLFAFAFALGYSEHVLPSLGDSLVGSIKGAGRRKARPAGPAAPTSAGTPD